MPKHSRLTNKSQPQKRRRIIKRPEATSNDENINSGRHNSVQLLNQRRLIYEAERIEIIRQRTNDILNGSLLSALQAPPMTFVRLPQSRTGPFKMYKYTAKDVTDDGDDVCSVCQQPRSINDSVIELSCSCSLKLHEKCAGQTFTADSKCPVCRDDMRTK